MTHADEPPLTDQDRRAIEEIRRQLEREFGPPWPELEGSSVAVVRTDHRPATAVGPIAPRRGGKGLRLALYAGTVTLGAAVIGALMSIADLSGQSRSALPPRAPAVVATTAPEAAPAPSGETNVRESTRRVVTGAERVTMHESAASGASSGGRRDGTIHVPPGRRAMEAQHRRWDGASVARYRPTAPVDVQPARSVPLASVQAP